MKNKMDRIRNYFDRMGKNVIDLRIATEINNKCPHCGYGKILTGDATLVSYSESENDSNESEKESKNVDFVYKTGCLSYDEEMFFE